MKEISRLELEAFLHFALEYFSHINQSFANGVRILFPTNWARTNDRVNAGADVDGQDSGALPSQLRDQWTSSTNGLAGDGEPVL